jgi:alkyl hydroperoxide reductase subunit F
VQSHTKEKIMLDAAIKTQLSAYLEKLQTPIELVASLDGSDAARQMRELLADIAALSPKVSVREDGRRCPQALVLRRPPGAKPRASASPASRWATNSPRWCWPCCRPAAIRPRSMPR